MLTGYHVWNPDKHWPSWGYWDGLYGYLFDPQASILWYFPVLLFAALAIGRFARRHPLDAMLMGAVFSVFFLLLGKTPTWRGDWTYGPRYMIFDLPVLALPFITWIDRAWERPWGLACWAGGALTAATLFYSAYLTERQNRLDFFVSYRVSEAIEPYWDRDIARYFVGHHSGWICADLIAHQDRPEDLVFLQDLARRQVAPIDLEGLRRLVRRLTTRENYYWRRSSRRLDVKR